MKHFAQCAGIAAIVMAAIPAYAQSLGDLARQEEARRAAVTQAATKLSNANLRPQDIRDPSSAPASESSCYMSISKGRCVSAEEMLAQSNAVVVNANAPREQEWRQEAAALRSVIEATQEEIRNLERRLASDRIRPGSETRADEKSLLRSREELVRLERKWARFETAAGVERIPRAWIEPIPALSKYQTPQ